MIALQTTIICDKCRNHIPDTIVLDVAALATGELRVASFLSSNVVISPTEKKCWCLACTPPEVLERMRVA